MVSTCSLLCCKCKYSINLKSPLEPNWVMNESQFRPIKLQDWYELTTHRLRNWQSTINAIMYALVALDWIASAYMTIMLLYVVHIYTSMMNLSALAWCTVISYYFCSYLLICVRFKIQQPGIYWLYSWLLTPTLATDKDNPYVS